MNEYEHEKNVYEIASYYGSRKLAVHITLINGKFYNGKITDANDLRIILLDKKLGEVYVPLNEVKDIEPFTEVKK